MKNPTYDVCLRYDAILVPFSSSFFLEISFHGLKTFYNQSILSHYFMIKARALQQPFGNELLILQTLQFQVFSFADFEDHGKLGDTLALYQRSGRGG
jgi:hypothetical protein